MANICKADLEKAASMLLQQEKALKTFEKKAEATRLLFKQVELGQIPAPRSYEECEEKVAALLDKDLSVIEEAVKLASAGSFNDIGTLEPPTLATSSGGIQSHRNAFEQAIMQGS